MSEESVRSVFIEFTIYFFLTNKLHELIKGIFSFTVYDYADFLFHASKNPVIWKWKSHQANLEARRSHFSKVV